MGDSLTLTREELILAQAIHNIIDDATAYVFEDITFYADSPDILIRVHRKPETSGVAKPLR